MAIIFDGRASVIGAGPWNGAPLGAYFETSAWAQDNTPNAGWLPRRCTLVADPLAVKGQVIRSELLAADRDAIASLPGSRRSELSQTAVLQTQGNTYWIGIDTLIQSPWVPDDGTCPCTLWQIHDTPDGGDPGRGPPFEFAIDGETWLLESRSAVTGGNDSSGQVLRKLVSGPLSGILDAWQSWVMRVTWAHTSGGAITIWRNGRRIFEESGPKNHFNDALGNFIASGVYCPVFWPRPGIASRAAFTTGMRIGDNAETFTTFTGSPELERVTPVRLALA